MLENFWIYSGRNDGWCGGREEAVGILVLERVGGDERGGRVGIDAVSFWRERGWIAFLLAVAGEFFNISECLAANSRVACLRTSSSLVFIECLEEKRRQGRGWYESEVHVHEEQPEMICRG